jgi:hypothetical protein
MLVAAQLTYAVMKEPTRQGVCSSLLRQATERIEHESVSGLEILNGRDSW